MREVARPLPLHAVRLTGGPLKHAQDLNGKYLLELEPDRMLAFYRQRAGLAPKAPPYGGWDGDGRNLTGHIAGHYLSAVSLMWAATGDSRFKDRADYIVSELSIVQARNGDGYLAALAGGRQAFEQLAGGTIRSASFDLNGLWSPWYTLHKTFAGLRDAYRHTGNRAALDVEIEFARWAERLLSHLTDRQVQQMLNTEFGGMNEVLADLYADTRDARWLIFSRRFDHHAVIDPLERGEDPLDGLHGNTQVPKLIGSAARAAYTGNSGDAIAASTFWDRVVHHHTFATGGHGKDEYFREPDRLGRIADGRTAESCNVYNMLKLTRRLFAQKPDIAYAEFQERALFNHVLGSMDPADGSTCYMVPVGRGVSREYQDMQRSFTCCVGTGMENHALHGDGIYYESGDRLWINLYVPSTASWPSAGVRLEAATDVPEGESAVLTFTIQAPRRFTLALRRPRWAGDGFAVAVNGRARTRLPRPGEYVELDRTWRDGDTVSLVLPRTLRLEAVPDNPRRVAILWGPLVLAGDLGPEPPRQPVEEGGDPNSEIRPVMSSPESTPVLVAAGRPVSDWLRPSPLPGSFRSMGVGRERDVDFVPFYRLHRRRYAAYWDLLTAAEYERRVADAAAERERIRRLDDVTVAHVRPGEGEAAFHPAGEGSSIVEADGRLGRRSSKWFSYEIPANAPAPLAIVATYHTDNRQPRTFQILVEGQRVGEQALPRSSESRFIDVSYPIPASLVTGKQSLTVRFQSAGGHDTGAVFGVRLIRDPAR